VETSRSPKTVIATVRGMGVAVMTSECASSRVRSTSRCSTPNRCCSSTTTRPRSSNRTCSDRSAWVPTTMPASPAAIAARARVRCRAGRAAVRISTRVPPPRPPMARVPSSAVIDRWCWWARTSVGASRAAWPPLSTTWSIARRATTVFPLPTSPWRRRCMGTSRARSAAISAPTARWPAVRANGRRASKAASTPSSVPGRGGMCRARTRSRRRIRAVWRTNASSKRRVWRARSQAASSGGSCTSSSASRAPSRCSAARTSGGTRSGTSSGRSTRSTVPTARRMLQVGRAAVAG